MGASWTSIVCDVFPFTKLIGYVLKPRSRMVIGNSQLAAGHVFVESNPQDSKIQQNTLSCLLRIWGVSLESVLIKHVVKSDTHFLQVSSGS